MQLIKTAVLAAAASAALAPNAAAATRADLAVTRLSEPPGALQPGAKLVVADAVRNAGRARAKATTVVYWLSADRRRNAGDVRAGHRRVKALKARRAARGKATLTLPSSLAAGAYHLLACADGASKVRERSERNNCRASRGRLAVTALALPGAPTPPVPIGASGAPAPATPTTPAAPGPAPATPGFPLAPDPITVSHTLDSARSVTQRIEGFGGTISATAADGTTYSLTLPNGALASGLDITLTPVTAVNGSPLSGGLIGAVEILPHGLELLKPATLTITPSGSAGPVAGQTGFLSHDQGDDFHLYPLDMGAELKLELMHFSTPGVAQADDEDRQVVLSHPPERRRAQLAQMMAEVLREARIEAIVNQRAGLPSDEMAAILKAYYTDIVAPVAREALTSDAKVAEGISELLGWARQVALTGLREHPDLKEWSDNALWDVATIIENAIARSYTRCVDQHDLDDIVRLIGLARAAALVGSPVSEEALDKAERCANFEIDLDSRITLDLTIDGTQSSHRATGTWHVAAENVQIPINGLNQNASLTWKAFQHSYTVTLPPNSNGCSRIDRTDSVSATPDNSVWFLLGMDLNLREPGKPPPANRDIRLRMMAFGEPGALEETYRYSSPQTCGGAPNDGTDTWHTWRDKFNGFHQSQEFEDWQTGSGELVATKRYTNADNGGYAETTTIELWHKPLK